MSKPIRSFLKAIFSFIDVIDNVELSGEVGSSVGGTYTDFQNISNDWMCVANDLEKSTLIALADFRKENPDKATEIEEFIERFRNKKVSEQRAIRRIGAKLTDLLAERRSLVNVGKSTGIIVLKTRREDGERRRSVEKFYKTRI